MRMLAMFLLELEVVSFNKANTYRSLRQSLPLEPQVRPSLEVVRYSGNHDIFSDFSILRLGPALKIHKL